MNLKALLLLPTLFILIGCVSHATSISEISKTVQPTPTIENANSNANNSIAYSDYRYDKILLDKLNEENERFRQVPDEFKSIDFKNFKYDFGRLKDGEYEQREPDNPLAGSVSYNFNDVFYVDLINDEKKEAVVFLNTIGCGASCDGGASVLYFYSSDNGKAKLIDIFETGSNSGGCSLKSFTIKNKKIYIEQFGRCKKNQTYEEGSTFACKFCTKDETHSTYSVTKNKLIRDSIEIFETQTINIMNSPTFVIIND